MSSRAAWRLLELGFTRVYRFKPGKMDWLANGLPFEGEKSGEQAAGDLANLDVPTCQPSEYIGDIRKQVSEKGWDVCVVVNEEEIVLGLLTPAALQSDPDLTAEQAMQGDVRTFRLNRKPSSVVEDMRNEGLDDALVTNVDGRLFGLLRRQDVEKAASA